MEGSETLQNARRLAAKYTPNPAMRQPYLDGLHDWQALYCYKDNKIREEREAK